MKNILLVEPAYKNKYPPIGLMKLSTFHKRKGHSVTFVKGMSKEALSKSWDRIYITTLFTFYFDITVSTIRFYKKAVDHIDDIYVGGILATLMHDRIKEAAGINNVVVGQLDSSTKIGYLGDENIDNLPIDYDMLDDVEYGYPAGDNYFAYTTRGCPNTCKFCAVPTLEPVFRTTNKIISQIKTINKRYGEKRNLLLLDNNVLHSPELEKIASDILKAGFIKKPNFIEPSPFLTYCRRIESRINSEKNILKTMDYLYSFAGRIKNEDDRLAYNDIVAYIAESDKKGKAILKQRKHLLPYIEKYISKRPKQRYVDFNQGIDARLLVEDENRMRLLSQLPINPLRIAFDHAAQSKTYEKALRLAQKYGFRSISNYMLYNHYDKPADLWKRLRINLDLRLELGLSIFSFPMKYIPITNTDREFIGKHWNKKYIRAIQSILLVKKGIVSTTETFFEKAFGKTLEEYFEILMMPEDFIIYRFHFERDKGLTGEWQRLYRALTENEKLLLLESIKTNKPEYLQKETYSERLKKILLFYEITYKEPVRVKQDTLPFD